MAKGKTTVDEGVMQDDLASVLADNLNKKFKSCGDMNIGVPQANSSVSR